jgi:hypothetical protein
MDKQNQLPPNVVTLGRNSKRKERPYILASEHPVNIIRMSKSFGTRRDELKIALGIL